MSYATGFTMALTFPAQAIGAGDITKVFRPSKGMMVQVVDIQIQATILFTAVTTSAKLQLGILGALTAYANFDTIGALAAGASKAATIDQPSAIVKNIQHPADTDMILTMKAPTGGSPAGTGDVVVKFNEF